MATLAPQTVVKAVAANSWTKFCWIQNDSAVNIMVTFDGTVPTDGTVGKKLFANGTEIFENVFSHLYSQKDIYLYNPDGATTITYWVQKV
jgi:hypothetical protein